ncbi:MAG: hypothetical protein J6K39_01410 [Clostridia bacterium]|nr:hypothetical protein [Clostridia bacterium]
MKKERVGWIFAVVILSVLLVVSVFLGVTGYFSSIIYLKSNSDLVVGDSVSISVRPNQTSVVSFTFDGGYLSNENIPQLVQINAADLNSELRVRVKATVFGLDENTDFEFITTSHFEQAEDGYYYFDDVLKGGNKITFCNYLKIPEDNDFSSGEKYILTIVVETLETKYDENIWKNVQQ